MSEKKKYLILKCPRCHAYQIADSRNKGKTCSQCLRRFQIFDHQVLATATDARDARRIVSDLKMPKGTKGDIAVSGSAASPGAN